MKRLLILLAFTAGCGRDDAQLYSDTVASVVHLRADDDSGTGVYVGDRYILTSYSLVKGRDEVRAYSAEEAQEHGARCSIKASDPRRDLALLRVETPGKQVALGRSPSPGHPVIVIGDDFLYGSSSVRLVQSRLIKFAPDQEIDSMLIQMSGAWHIGSPVLDREGELVGMISGIPYMAIDATEIDSFLKRHLK